MGRYMMLIRAEFGGRSPPPKVMFDALRNIHMTYTLFNRPKASDDGSDPKVCCKEEYSQVFHIKVLDTV